MAEAFDLQDEMAVTLAAVIEPALGRAERDRARLMRPDSIGTWELYQRGMAELYRRTPDSLAEAVRLLEQTTESDPEFAPAYCGLTFACFWSGITGGPGAMSKCADKALAAARRAVELDAADAVSHSTLGKVHHLRGEYEAAYAELETAIRLNPGYADAHYNMGAALAHSGQPEQAIPYLQTAIDLSPQDPIVGPFYTRMAEAYLFMERYDNALDCARQGLRQPSRTLNHFVALISVLGHLGRGAAATAAIAELNEFRPGVTQRHVREHTTVRSDDLERIVDGLRMAGLAD